MVIQAIKRQVNLRRGRWDLTGVMMRIKHRILQRWRKMWGRHEALRAKLAKLEEKVQIYIRFMTETSSLDYLLDLFLEVSTEPDIEIIRKHNWKTSGGFDWWSQKQLRPVRCHLCCSAEASVEGVRRAGSGRAALIQLLWSSFPAAAASRVWLEQTKLPCLLISSQRRSGSDWLQRIGN